MEFGSHVADTVSGDRVLIWLMRSAVEHPHRDATLRKPRLLAAC
jgi:hypothetical protein